jgi:Ca2+-binding EF-hand superfamily protein
LSSTYTAQISEIFKLFDTDGTGSIEQHELGFALSALGFKSKKGSCENREEQTALDAIMDDGKVTLEEFIALMTGDIMSGDIGGYGLYEEARTAFSVLSRPDGDSRNDGLITLEKLESACKEFQVLSALLALLAFSCCIYLSETCLYRCCYRLRT